MLRFSPLAALIALTALTAPASAQIGAVIASPLPDGLAEGQGAGHAKGNYHALDALPDWGGIWFMIRPPRGADAAPPPRPLLKGEYLEGFNAWRAEVQANNGLVKRERSNCAPPGMPLIMQLGQYPYEFLFTPGRVTINQEAWMQTRTIWTDGRSHPEDPDPTYMGHSIGHWEGGVLVVDTIGVSDMLDMAYGAGHSDKFRVTERIQLDPENADELVNEITLLDPDALETPFTVTIRYGRDRNGALIEFQCSENDRNQIDHEGNTAAF